MRNSIFNRLRVALAITLGIGYLAFVLTHLQEIIQFADHAKAAVEAFIESWYPTPQFTGPMTNAEGILFMLSIPVLILLFTVFLVILGKGNQRASDQPTDEKTL